HQNGFGGNAHMNEPVAIIGMSCGFPGANSINEFWPLLLNGVDGSSDIPPSRISVEGCHSQIARTPTKVASREGGFLQDIDLFDAEFFGTPPREANLLDPQQRLLLEVAWEALEDAGQARDRMAGSRTGVYIGMWTNEYEDRVYAS